MLRFFRGLWRIVTALKNTLANLIFLLIVALVLVAIFSADVPEIQDTTALVLDPTGYIVEQKRAIDPINRILSGNNQTEAETLLSDLKKAIRQARSDDRIRALVLDLSGLDGAPISMLQELGVDIREFKTIGKPVYAFGPSYTQAQYLLAVHADEVYLDEDSFGAIGGVFLTGVGTYPTFFRSALEKLKVKLHVFRVGEYKSAVEPFLLDSMSDESKEANLSFLNGLWDSYTQVVTTERGLTEEEFYRYTNEYDVALGESGDDPSATAVSFGLVDELVSRKGFEAKMKGIVGATSTTYNQVSFRDYLSLTQPPIPMISPTADKVAVITAKGTILDGEQPAGDIGGETIANLIRDARSDKTVKAIVMRVDSPGGSVTASERIRSELAIAQSEGKPVVVSMSSFAASGGYWISASSNKIFAQPTTITGSIGAFLVLPTFDEAITELGVNSDGVGTTTLSGSLNPLNPINPVLERTLQKSIELTYKRFIQVVADGREMDPSRVNEIARGRVWTGKQALEIGLIDALGSLPDAIEAAASLADLSEYEVLELEKGFTTRERLINQIVNGSVSSMTPHHNLLGKAPPALALLSQQLSGLLEVSRAPGVYLECFTCRAVSL